jgi:hypothetical protein
MSYRVRLRWSVTAVALPLLHTLPSSCTVYLNKKEASITEQDTVQTWFWQQDEQLAAATAADDVFAAIN